MDFLKNIFIIKKKKKLNNNTMENNTLSVKLLYIAMSTYKNNQLRSRLLLQIDQSLYLHLEVCTQNDKIFFYLTTKAIILCG